MAIHTLHTAPWAEHQGIKAIVKALSGQVRLVGGCVRDAVLGKAMKDIDMATPLTPQETMEQLQKAGIRVIPTGIGHGTVTAIIDHQPFEITTLREDSACDGRHAEVRFTTDWQQDAARRDFTFNALSATPEGKIYDYFGGMEDARAGRVRFVGKASDRCREDYLRILRFFRFFAWYGTPPADKEALQACREESSGINGLSGERIQAEMIKLLSAPAPLASLQLMEDAGILALVLPGKAKLGLLEALHALNPAADALLRLSALLHTLPAEKNTIEALAVRWKLSKKDRITLEALHHPLEEMDTLIAEVAAQKAVLRQMGREAFTGQLWLAMAQAKQAGRDTQPYQPMLELAATWQIPSLPIGGGDVVALGVAPGKQVGRWLEEAEIFWESEDYQPSKPALLEYLKKRLKE